ncbi:TIGR03862 family flavoprotein [Pseudomonas aeruginosa]
MPSQASSPSPQVAIVGGGPAGLMAAEVLSQAGVRTEVFDVMPSVGRKFLLAGVGGMNITHAEAREQFLGRYGRRQKEIAALLGEFDADALRAWIHGLGIDTFVGSSGRVFPSDMKAAPLLRAWLKRLREQGVLIHTRCRWLGWNADGTLDIQSAAERLSIRADAVILALGGGSWQRLGSDGAWVPLLRARGVEVEPLRPSNCGFEIGGWSELFRDKFSGAPVKPVAMGLAGETPRQGEFVVTRDGIEGSLVYALSAAIRERIEAQGSAEVWLDLLPNRRREQIEAALARPRGSRSMANHLRSQLGIDGVRAGLLREFTPAATYAEPARLAAAIKRLPLTLLRPRPLDEAISSAGGVRFEALDRNLMLDGLPGVFCAGEMLDWEAPTGGYLLTACFASGRVAGLGALAWLRGRR